MLTGMPERQDREGATRDAGTCRKDARERTSECTDNERRLSVRANGDLA
jgi:hypothetical protein